MSIWKCLSRHRRHRPIESPSTVSRRLLAGESATRYRSTMSAPELASPTWLLVKSCQDLVTKSQSPDFYGKLRMAGLLRHLLVGSHALAVRAKGELDTVEEPLVFWFREPP